MFNCYEGYMDTNLVIPVDVDHCRVIFDFYFGDVSEAARAYNEQSVAVGNRVQDEDLGNLRSGAARTEIASLSRRTPVGAARSGRTTLSSVAGSRLAPRSRKVGRRSRLIAKRQRTNS